MIIMSHFALHCLFFCTGFEVILKNKLWIVNKTFELIFK